MIDIFTNSDLMVVGRTGGGGDKQVCCFLCSSVDKEPPGWPKTSVILTKINPCPGPYFAPCRALKGRSLCSIPLRCQLPNKLPSIHLDKISRTRLGCCLQLDTQYCTD